MQYKDTDPSGLALRITAKTMRHCVFRVKAIRVSQIRGIAVKSRLRANQRYCTRTS